MIFQEAVGGVEGVDEVKVGREDELPRRRALALAVQLRRATEIFLYLVLNTNRNTSINDRV